ncbi:bifunctional 4-hydroxy-2-oxoglutarate aldolase/2-dehydro-3-deoxy-phosphogluconate aldolase [Geobacillus thermodenitrificans]|jgi:2-dehydro-3-deoxyphosphogluconate aldolase / (4S)-4-hydroxy-2-oxoglutarate aldolase|uniref:bifunctional 4-hydroxy-2-oxoglutarate aldolase/2-dehydro-3-deoxy-phosphogluconate aldolase n=1 Tax=Geobacillus thermodenitrificans TaxID=33940 RepID=UPI000415E9B2|nr:bifunctional 4-hydroxy-2-oxoglutarate aldolase/2-dehydro-3-deoxy-phosphogluconate aldolase [Geobacillus thermodenitrificans]ARA96573.1 2-dehydro-3-deoxyphosphogluconate aldolase [Geobacillus thermodenitrificans]ARA99634.1 2-dehydro-3-deoxyphosphogluconate aldolase [Geobacillus thermodenitrificans]MED3718443.1 bifunctional 4-hydroxy-2-oxoglutarate aldolase/2-dehydro-3-deoxy-phosphogluconate aldolase [Geobacillus thermodenitrificans]
MDVLTTIKKIGIVPVVRGATVDNILPIASALRQGGIPIIEITMETTEALAALEKATNELNDMLIGAGTVLDSETAQQAIFAGARFIVSPSLSVDVIKATKQHQAISIAGGLTPTEIVTAFQQGADMVKIFPAHVFGPKYIQSLKDPLPHIPLMVTGGINRETVGEYIKAGADVAGIGGSLVNVKHGWAADELEAITQRATELVSIIQKERKEEMHA